MNAQRCNGWTNYETWNVHLWLDNDRGGTYHFWRETAAECYDKCFGKDNAWENAIDSLTKRLNEEIEAHHPYRGEFLAKPLDVDLYCDLLDSALSKVNYREIAEAFLDDLDESGYFRERYAEEIERHEGS